MNSAELVAKHRFAPDRPLAMPTEGKSIQVAWDDFLTLADRIEALEAWKAEAMDVLKPFARPQNPQALPRDFDAARRFYEKHKGGE
ncbi:hypothetical protein ABMA46_10050 [Mesorhizobium sp. CN5-321]|uniref:hypothetical protein n=1 Tax=Mesorhizobium hunchu TaxID=3157708 RepID=UPI0032B70AA4